MAGFNSALDKVIASWNYEGLAISVNAYNGGDPKLNIGPRVVQFKNGNTGYRSPGRTHCRLFHTH